jgi:hypothetical protein
MALELCISDSNKPLLLAHRGFLPYVVDALLLEADHPRADMKPELKSWCQQLFAAASAAAAAAAAVASRSASNCRPGFRVFRDAERANDYTQVK